MTIRFRCASGHLLSIGDEHAGKRLRCPKCLKISIVPQQSLPAEPVLVTASVGSPAMSVPPPVAVEENTFEPAVLAASSSPTSPAQAQPAALESAALVGSPTTLPDFGSERPNHSAAVPVATPPQAAGPKSARDRQVAVPPPTLLAKPPVALSVNGDGNTAHAGSAGSAPPVAAPPLPQRASPPRLPNPELARPIAPFAPPAPIAPPVVASPRPEVVPPLPAAVRGNVPGGKAPGAVALPRPADIPPLPPLVVLPPAIVPMARLAVVNPFAEDPREQAPVEFEGDLKQAVDETALHAFRSAAIGYRPDRYKLQNVYLLAMGLSLVTLFNAAPALKFWDVSQAPDWARIVLLMTLLQFGFIAWMVLLPDWSTVWVSMLVFASVATLYGVALAIAVMTPHGRPVALEMDDVRHSARLWCAAVILLTCSMTYLCGRMSHKWYKAYQLGR